MQDDGRTHCSSCDITIAWPPIWLHGHPYCCIGCALGGPRTCSYNKGGDRDDAKMKMILAIVQDEDFGQMLANLSLRGLRATKISSTGGFLRSGNSTIMIGVEDDQVAPVLDIIRVTCHTRKQTVTAMPFPADGPAATYASFPAEVEAGGANIFVWDVDQHVRV